MDKPGVVKIPLTLEVVLSTALIGTLAVIGTVYIYVLYKRKRCQCLLCRGDFIVGECIGGGGFGDVFLCYSHDDLGNRETRILKQIEMQDLCDLEYTQHEAK